MSNNFYQPKNEFGKALVAVSTPKSVAGAANEDYIDLSWLETQDNLVFEANKKKVVTSDALKALQEQIHGQIQFKFIMVTEESPLPEKITEANLDDLRTSIYIKALTTNKETGIDEYAEYVCTNTADFISDEETPSVAPKFERFGIGVAKATASVQGAVTLSDTADDSKDASEGVAATPKAVADTVSAAKTELEGKIKSAADKAAEDLAEVQSQLDEVSGDLDTLEKTVAGHTTKITNIEKTIEGLDDLKDTVEELEGDVGTLKTDVEKAKTDITTLQSDVSDLEEKVAGMEDAAEGVAVVGTLSLTVPAATGSVKADFPLETSLVRFEVIEDGVATTMYPGITYATAGDKKQEITLTFWKPSELIKNDKTVKAHYVTTKAKAALFAEQDADPEEEEEEQGGAQDGDEANKQD